jgi:diguanylate cyclase (GGDEF)-like protein
MRVGHAAPPLERSQRLILLGVLLMGFLASLLSLVSGVRSAGVNPPDWAITTFISVLFGGLLLALWRGWVSTRLVGQIGLTLMLIYQLGNLTYRAVYGTLASRGLGDGALWFALFFPLAFLLLPLRAALLTSAGYYLAGLGITALSLLTTQVNGDLNLANLNPIGQFFLSHLALLVMIYLYARSQAEYSSVHQMAHTDALTGLPNRRLMGVWLEHELRGHSPLGFSILLVDIDHFKRVNDTHGHATGDQALREVGMRLASALRTEDEVCRWGGEEFLVLAPNTDCAGAQQLAGRLSQAVREEPLLGGIPITVSVGVACWREGDNAETLVHRADEAMYRAKASGRNRLEVAG